MNVVIQIPFDLQKDFERSIGLLKDELDAIGEEMTNKIISILESKGKKASGDLIASVEDEVKQVTNGMMLVVGPSTVGALYVDEGLMAGKYRRIGPLKKWAAAKFGVSGKQMTQIAYAARRKIFKRGVEPVNFIRQTMDLFIPTIAKRIADRMTLAYAGNG